MWTKKAERESDILKRWTVLGIIDDDNNPVCSKCTKSSDTVFAITTVMGEVCRGCGAVTGGTDNGWTYKNGIEAMSEAINDNT